MATLNRIFRLTVALFKLILAQVQLNRNPFWHQGTVHVYLYSKFTAGFDIRPILKGLFHHEFNL